MLNVLLLGVLGAASALAATATAPTTDDALAFDFKAPLVNGLSTDSLQALRGRPVLVEFWGTY